MAEANPGAAMISTLPEVPAGFDQAGSDSSLPDAGMAVPRSQDGAVVQSDSDGDDAGPIVHGGAPAASKLGAMADFDAADSGDDDVPATARRRGARTAPAVPAPAAADDLADAAGSGDEYNSGAEQVADADDMAFIDGQDDNLDILREYAAPQEFHDERPAFELGEDDGAATTAARQPKANAGRKRARNKALDETQAIARAGELLGDMFRASWMDREALANPQSGLRPINRASMLQQVSAQAQSETFQQLLLDGADVEMAPGQMQNLTLPVCLTEWLKPNPDGSLAPLVVRTGVYSLLASLRLNRDSLQSGGIARVVLAMSQHPGETEDNRKRCRALVNTWTRHILNGVSSSSSAARRSHARAAQRAARGRVSQQETEDAQEFARRAAAAKHALSGAELMALSAIDSQVKTVSSLEAALQGGAQVGGTQTDQYHARMPTLIGANLGAGPAEPAAHQLASNASYAGPSVQPELQRMLGALQRAGKDKNARKVVNRKKK